MSLINDALKRAKQAQPNAATTADGPTLQPARAPRAHRAENDLLLPALVVVILLLAGMLLWQWFHSGSEVQVHARTIPIAEVAQQPTPNPAENPQGARPEGPIHNPQSPTLPVPPTNTIITTATTPALPVPTNTTTVVQAPTAPAAPPPITYKLQSIFYRARNPSAVINGKTLFVGDRVAEAHVVAIDQDSATIVTAKGEKKVLELP